MARSAGRLTVAAKLHFPEESFAQSDSCILVLDEIGKFSSRWAGDSNGFQRSKTTAIVTTAAVAAFTTATISALTAASITTFAAASAATVSTAATIPTIAISTTPATSAFSREIGDAE